MMRLFTVLLVCALMISCEGNTQETTPNGYKVNYVKRGDRKLGKPGEILVLNLAILDQKDSAWYDNRKTGYPDMIQIPEETEKVNERGITEVFRMLSKGDSISFHLPAQDMFMMVWKVPVPQNVDPKSNFHFEIKCSDVMNQAAASKYRNTLDSARQVKMAAQYAAEEKLRVEYDKAQLGKDTVIIDNFLKQKGVRFSKLNTGIRYITKAQGHGAMVQNGDICTMKYTGTSLDGKEFDSGEYSFTVGNGDVIKGWELMAAQMKPGMAVTAFIPSILAYGKSGSPPVIMPDAVLIFEMELLEVKKP